jgi:hypothetical protein
MVLLSSSRAWRLVPYDRPKIQLPEPRGYVSDHAQAIDGVEERIRSVCQDLGRRPGVEMVVVTIPTIKLSVGQRVRDGALKSGASDRRQNMACWCWSQCGTTSRDHAGPADVAGDYSS